MYSNELFNLNSNLYSNENDFNPEKSYSSFKVHSQPSINNSYSMKENKIVFRSGRTLKKMMMIPDPSSFVLKNRKFRTNQNPNQERISKSVNNEQNLTKSQGKIDFKKKLILPAKCFMHQNSIKDYLKDLKCQRRDLILFDTTNHKFPKINLFKNRTDNSISFPQSPNRNVKRECLKLNIDNIIGEIMMKIQKYFLLNENKKVFHQNIIKSVFFEPQLKNFLQDKKIESLTKQDFISFIKSFQRTHFYYSKRKSSFTKISEETEKGAIVQVYDISDPNKELNIGLIEKSVFSSLASLNKQMDINIYKHEIQSLKNKQNFITTNISFIEKMKGYTGEVKSSLKKNFKKFSFRNADIIERIEEYERKRGTNLNLSDNSRALNKELLNIIVSLKKIA